MQLSRSLKHFDWLFFAGILLLTLVGLMMIYSTGLAGKAESTLWLRQLVAAIFGLVGLFFFATLDYRFFKKNAWWLYLLSLGLLLSLFLFSKEIRGTSRWFNFGLINFQPAEISKFALLFVLAKFFQTSGHLLQKFRYVLFSLIYVVVPGTLLVLQPDLGSTVVHLALWLGLLLLSPMPKRYLLYLFVGLLIFSMLAWQFFLISYQKDRVRTFFSPGADPLGRGYNVIQAMVAVGSGGVFGSGLARGLQSQLKFLPERQTDFIFASTVEELGMVGGGLVILLFGFVLWRMIRIIKFSQDPFATYLAVGIFFLIFIQSLVNIGMNLGLLPVTGITLPYVSYGGSSLVVSLWLAGIMESIAQHSVPVRF